MTYQAKYEDYARLLMKLSRQSFNRAAARGGFVEFDELMGIAQETFARALEKYDPNLDVKFSTYLWTAVANNLSSFVKKSISIQFSTDSIDRELGEEGGTMHDIIAASDEAMDDRLARLENTSEMFSRLSENAKRVIMVLYEPTPEIVREIKRVKAFRLHCKEHRMAAAARPFDVAFVCAALQLNEEETRDVKTEFKTIMEEVYG